MQRRRDAANSRASGNPSRRWHTCTTASAVCSLSVKPGSTPRARCTNSATDGHCSSAASAAGAPAGMAAALSGMANVPRSKVCSPGMSRLARLVAKMRTSLASHRIWRTSELDASKRCSQLSKMSSIVLWARNSTRRTSAARVVWSGTASAASIIGARASLLSTPVRSKNHTPSGYCAHTALPTSIDRRVLPIPPGPVRVTSRD